LWVNASQSSIRATTVRRPDRTQFAPVGKIVGRSKNSHWLRENLNRRGAVAVIPSKAIRARRIAHDAEMYKWRHLIENFFCCLKAFRRIATRYEKTDACFGLDF
jgi:transposase